MGVVQIVFSPTGGTQKVADIIASELGGSFKRVDLSDPGMDFDQVSLDKGDLAVIAVPSFGGRVPALAVERLEKIHGNQAMCAIVCVYGNRAYEDTLLELGDAAGKSGFRVIAAVAAVAEHSIAHQYAAGRPDEADSRQLRDFAGKILEKVKGGDGASAPQLPGNRPYKKSGGSGFVPAADQRCNGCGLCAEKCPAQAISRENPRETDGEKCISCMRCVSICPQSAREMDSARTAAVAQALAKVCSDRKDNQLFI